MTREETIKILTELSNKRPEDGVLFSVREAAKEAAKLLSQPQLPANLDEAAEDAQQDLYGGFYSGHIEAYQEAFKRGARWMAERAKLTWKDAQDLWIISRQVGNELDSAKDTFPKWSSSSKEMFEEILRRFYERKGGAK